MSLPICTTCGTQFPESPVPPPRCPICDEPRQWVPESGQAWTTLEQLRVRHRNAWRRLEPELYEVGTEPAFAIGQRAFLVRSPGGNVLWDCVALIDDATVDLVRALGGVRAIAISHPHYYTTCVEWARAFDAPVLLHAADREWVMRPGPGIEHWDGEPPALHDGLTLVRAGGHFAGGTVLHWPAGAGGRGALLVGDILQVVSDTRWVSFMWSYPNLTPLPAAAVQRVVSAVLPYEFDRLYGAFARHILHDARGAVVRSLDRYLHSLGADSPALSADRIRTEVSRG